MGGVADEDDLAVAPAAGLHPFDGAEVQLLIVLEGGQVGRDRAAEAGEPPPEPFQAAGGGSSNRSPPAPAKP
jgi:hypothetical protein